MNKLCTINENIKYIVSVLENFNQC